ncbi:MAG: hypothetical protein EAZ38_18620 [Cytophagales bacterium]|nr:MAG: hypothetical protein EAZ38_18620 [Cytophagales bacterium]
MKVFSAGSLIIGSTRLEARAIMCVFGWKPNNRKHAVFGWKPDNRKHEPGGSRYHVCFRLEA